VTALFDNDRMKIGQRIGPDEINVYDVRKFERVVAEEKDRCWRHCRAGPRCAARLEPRSWPLV